MSEMDRDEALRLSIRDRVLRRAGDDEDFRRLLMDNPKSAIARELGIDVPEGVHVTVLPESPNHVFVVLPSLPAHTQQPIVTGVERLAAGAGLFVYAANVSPAYGGSMPGTTMAHMLPAYGPASNQRPGLPGPGGPDGPLKPGGPLGPGTPGGPRGPILDDQ